MDREDVVYTKEMWYICTHGGIPLHHKKEWNFAICDSMDEPYAKWNKSDWERQP